MAPVARKKGIEAQGGFGRGTSRCLPDRPGKRPDPGSGWCSDVEDLADFRREPKQARSIESRTSVLEAWGLERERRNSKYIRASEQTQRWGFAQFRAHDPTRKAKQRLGRRCSGSGVARRSPAGLRCRRCIGRFLRPHRTGHPGMLSSRGFTTAAFVSIRANFKSGNLGRGFGHFDEPDKAVGPYRPADGTRRRRSTTGARPRDFEHAGGGRRTDRVPVPATTIAVRDLQASGNRHWAARVGRALVKSSIPVEKLAGSWARRRATCYSFCSRPEGANTLELPRSRS